MLDINLNIKRLLEIVQANSRKTGTADKPELLWGKFALQTLDVLSDAIAVLDDTGCIVLVNNAWREFSKANGGMSDYYGLNVFELCKEADGADSETALKALFGMQSVLNADKDSFEMEYTCHSPREERWFKLKVARRVHGGKTFLITIHENITGQKKNELLFANSESLYRNLFDNYRQPVLLIREGRVGEYNRRAVEFLKIRHGSYPSFPLKELFVDETQAGLILKKLEEISISDGVAVIRCNIKDFEQNLLQTELTFYSIKMNGYKQVCLHIDDLKLEAARDRETAMEKKYRQFFDDDLTGDFIGTADGRILECNRAFARMFGCKTIEKAKQVNFGRLFYKSEDCLKMQREIEKNGRLEFQEWRLKDIEGNALYVTANLIGEFDGTGNLIQVRGYLFDITRRKELESRYLQVQKLDAIGRLAGGIAHDFNNILSIINGYSQLLLMELKQSKNREMAKMIFQSGERASKLTAQLLAFSRKQVSEKSVFRLNDLINDLLKMLKRIIGEDIDLQTVLGENLPGIEADPVQMEQVLMNLVINARDAMPEGGVLKMKTSLVRPEVVDLPPGFELNPGEYLLIEISDSGTGIADSDLEHIFEPFFTTKAAGRGTGLGLSTAYGIVKQNGGKIDFESVRCQGTVFRVYFPAAIKSAEKQDNGKRPALPAGRNEYLLLVEDEPLVREMMEEILVTNGYRVKSVASAEKAYNEFMEKPDQFELIVTDIILPGKRGNQLVSEIRKIRPQLKVVYISGYTMDIEEQVKSDLNAIVVRKPILPWDLLRKLREFLRG